jgi:predicted nuclease of predicted toxin-antitoxin system
MALCLYMDVHVQKPITIALQLRGVDMLTAQEDNTTTLFDHELLDRATSLGRVLFTRDRDFLTEAARYQASGIPFAGVIYAHQLQVTIGACIDDLELLAKACDPPDLANRVEYLPLR